VERSLCLIGGIGLGAGLLASGLTMRAPWACVVGSLGLGLVAASLAGTDLVRWAGAEGEPGRQREMRRGPRPAYAGAYI
jgi:hypothetical protein